MKELDKDQVPADASSLKYTLNKVLETKTDNRPLMNGDWILAQLNNAPLNRMVVLPTMSIDLSKNLISGNTGCNNYSTTIKNLNDTGIYAS